MYQFIVLLALFTVVIGGGFYIKKSDGEGVLKKAFSSSGPVDTFIMTSENVSGSYYCSVVSGCSEYYKLNITTGGTAEMVTSYEGGMENVVERGTWAFGEKGAIDVSLVESMGNYYDIPHLIKINTVSSSTFKNIIYDSKIYPDMKNPVFIKELD